MPDDLLTPLPTPPSAAELEAQQFDAVTAPAADPNAYNLPWYGRAAAIEDPAVLHDLDQGLRQFAADVGFPAGVGSGVLQQAVDDLRRIGDMSDADLAVYTASQRVLLGRILPGVTADQIVAGAEKVLKRADPQFLADARETGLFSSAALLVQLYVQSLRSDARAGR